LGPFTGYIVTSPAVKERFQSRVRTSEEFSLRVAVESQKSDLRLSGW
jgi:hypothetical protein